jgi:hypothetical protein
MRAPMVIPEKDEPVLRVSLRTLKADGTYQIDDLTGGTVQWISKANEKVTDASGVTINGTITNPSTDPVAVIQIEDTVTGVAGSFFYKIVVMLNAHPLTYRYGPLTIAST